MATTTTRRTIGSAGVSVSTITRVLHKIAPLEFAAAWDNVGLLVDQARDSPVSRIFLTNDLTEPVLQEAIERRAQFVVTYHPTPFRKFKKLTRKDPVGRIVLRCAAEGIAVYSPHTASDAAKGGVNDWLVGGCGEGSVRPVQPVEDDSEVGMGRIMTLSTTTSLETIIQRIKSHLNIPAVRVATAFSQRRAVGEYGDDGAATKASERPLSDVTIKRVAVCAGSGASVLQGCEADLYVTGEMSHHEVLAANASGASVVLCDHSNTERGYLKELAATIDRMIKEEVRDCDVEVFVSSIDRDPLCVV
eukprot:g1514.t1